MKRFATIMAVIAIAVACSRPEQPQTELISVGTSVSRAPQVADWPCKVVMHRSTSLGRIGSEGYKPYFETWFGSIDSYLPSVAKYNTQTAYPSNYDYVTMSGFAPAMENDRGSAEDSAEAWLLDMCDNYSRVRVNYGDAEYNNTVWQSIAVAGPKVGSSISPYRDESDALDFHFATFRVKFRAIRSQNMKNLGVMDAHIIMSPEYVPVDIRWDSETGSYFPKGDGSTEIDALLRPANHNRDNIISQDTGSGEQQYAETDYIYLCKPNSGFALSALHINLSLTYSRDTEHYEESSRYPGLFGTKFGGEDVSVSLQTPDNVPVTSIQPGQSYIVTIVFDQDSFTLAGISEDWEDGGNVILPILNPVPTT